MRTFGETVKLLRNKLDITGEDLGKVLNVSKPAISNWENNNRTPDIEMLIKIADYFNVTLDYLMGRADHPTGYWVNDKIDNDEIAIEVDRDVYPDNLTHAQVLKIIEKYNKLKAAVDNLAKDK